MSNNPVNIDRTVKKLTPHSEENLAQTYLKMAGDELRGASFELLGSWGVHVYQSPITRELEFKVQTRLPFDTDDSGTLVGVTEQMALVSFEEAKKTLQALYRKNK